MSKKTAPLIFKPDLEEAAKRWEAFYHGDIIDRPVTCIYSPKKGYENKKSYYSRYTERVLGNIDEVIDKTIESAESTYFGGEAIPSFCPTMGPDEIAVFCGGELCWGDNSTDTNWSKPFITDWADSLPLRINEENPIWKRLMELYSKASDKMFGKMILQPIDLHSNMDLLAAVRGPQNLCMDLIDEPEMIDKAMESARAVFPVLWEAMKKAGRMDESGYYQAVYSMEGAATLQCDFSIMMNPSMFKRWVLPALEEEAEIVKNVMYHWDGVGALSHFEALMTSKGMHTMSFIPGEGQGRNGKGDQIDFIDVLKKIQSHGKAVHVWGTPEQIKIMHKELRPEKVIYNSAVKSQDEADSLLEWLTKNT